MGIKDLLQKLKFITKKVWLRQQSGSSAAVMAVDASCILHRRASLQPRKHALDHEDSE